MSNQDAGDLAASAIAGQIEKLRTKLLDLTTRNPLIAFTHGARNRRFVRIIDEVPDQLYSKLQSDGGVMRFRSLGDAEDEPAEERTITFRRALDAAKLEDEEYLRKVAELGEDPGDKALAQLEQELRTGLRERLGMSPRMPVATVSPAEAARRQGLDPSFDLPVFGPTASKGRHTDSTIQTLLFAGPMERTFAKIQDQVKLSLTETGVNPLFCVFGFIEWYEEDSSTTPLHAPLLLHPLQIERELVRGHFVYTVKSTGEGAMLNVAIAERLKRDFEITLPDFTDEMTPEQYFAAVQKVLEVQKSWKLRRWATVGLFSFARIAMYHDLDPNHWKTQGGLERHRQIGRLIHGSDGGSGGRSQHFFEDTEEAIDGAELDIPLIADADSSQLTAIREVLAGRSLVIEGPPGTGKSQTITNIIAAALAAGKSVLFLAEKNAALNVVKNRLAKAGLQDFCLELHSTKAGRKETAKALANRLSRLPSKSVDADLVATLRELGAAKQQLRKCVEALSEPAGNLGISTHDLLWRCSRIRERTTHLPLGIDTLLLPNADSLTEVDLARIVSMAERLERVRDQLVANYGSARSHPWYGVANADLDVLKCEDLVRKVGSLADIAAAAAHVLDSLRAETGWAPDKLGALRSVSPIAAIAAPDQKSDGMIVRKLADRQVLASVQNFVSEIQEHARLLAELRSAFLDHVNIDACDVRSLQALVDVLPSAAIGEGSIRELAGLADRREREASAWESVQSLMADIASRAGHSAPLNATAEKCLVISVSLAADALQKVGRARTPALLAAGAFDALKQAHTRLDALRKRRAALRQHFSIDAERDSADLLKHAKALRTAPPIPWFKWDWWQARSRFRGLCVVPLQADRTQMASRLEEIARLIDDTQTLERDDSLRSLFGPAFNGIDSDANPPGLVAQWADKVRVQLPQHAGTGIEFRKFLFECSVEQLEGLGSLATHPKFADLQRIVSANRSEDTTVASQQLSARLRAQKTREACSLSNSLGLRPDLSVDKIAGITSRVARLHSIADDVANSRTASAALGPRFQGLATELEPVIASLQHAQAVSESDADPRLREWLLQGDPHQRWKAIHPIALASAEALACATTTISDLASICKIDYQCWLSHPSPLDTTPTDLAEHARRCAGDPEGLQMLIDFARLAADLQGEGFGPLLATMDTSGRPVKRIDDACRRLVYQSLMRAILGRRPALAAFSADRFEGFRSQFCKLDHKLQVLRQKKIGQDLERRAIDPGSNTGARKEWTGLALARLEASKSTRHFTVRDLLDRAGNAIKQLMPCFMMSPLSVAQYLKPGQLEFDLVIMDEASQLRPEDALGAIGRAGQVVIVGDPKQLPPTTFFDRGDVAVSEEDEGTAVDEKSILELAASIMSMRRLTWHYRSTHPALIAFSNREFYDNKLVVFPSPKHKDPALGVRYVHVAEGRYNKTVNQPEAQRVAEAAVEHARNCPGRSLGIVTLNKAQAELLRMELDTLAAQHPEFEAWRKQFDDTLEPFFVKNLENVQGDERDCIFISTVYGKDDSGNLHQRFGPINQQGGHRRLNVLFTRAKCQTVVFSTMDPGDIRTDESSPWGLRALKGFLAFAKNGVLDVPMETGREPDSDFEIAVADVLGSAGYNVVFQVGVAGYFIDLAVRHPERPGEFVLGIECDGATYHSVKSARDRDRLRQEILERLKWRIHRIWSVEWYRNNRREQERLLQAVKLATQAASE